MCLCVCVCESRLVIVALCLEITPQAGLLFWGPLFEHQPYPVCNCCTLDSSGKSRRGRVSVARLVPTGSEEGWNGSVARRSAVLSRVCRCVSWSFLNRHW